MIASTRGSFAACSRNACTDVENESYGWCSRMSRARMAARMSPGLLVSTPSVRSRWVPVKNGGNRRLAALEVGDEVEAAQVQRRGRL
ncbi:hypothetical protein GCM10025868_28130 [Angustibacter aerolatus]|uniref:Uncharacterized protein n=1 Tax=Angustibacter aerolatus TaxID=1162965 RepID=A0ABQ6JH95_9ACTN|nr:hypothetical protein GCM10025868_28130 [Angustibacter aerolatus]